MFIDIGIMMKKIELAFDEINDVGGSGCHCWCYDTEGTRFEIGMVGADYDCYDVCWGNHKYYKDCY